MKAVSARAHVVAVLVGLLLLVAPGLVSAQQGPGYAAFRQGQQYRQEKNYDAAIAKFREAINLERNNYRYYIVLGDCERATRKYNEAIQSYRQALTLNREYAAAHVRIASSYIKLKNYNGAIQSLNSAYDMEKDAGKRLSYKLNAVKLLVRQNRPQEAMVELNKVKANNADDARVMMAEGDVFGAQNNWPAAIAAYQRGVDKMKAQPLQQSAKYYYALGQAYFKSGNTAKAKETWESVKNTPFYRKAQGLIATSGAAFHIRVSRGYYSANLLDDAIEFANKAIAAEPQNPAGYQMLASVLFRKGQSAQALTNLNKAAELQQDEAKRNKLYNSIVSRQFASGDYNGALATANRILAKNPTSAPVLGLKAQAEFQLGRFNDAIATAEKATAAGKGDQSKVAGFQFTQGLAAKRAGNNEMARTMFTNVTKVNSPFRFAARIENEKISAR